MQTAEHVLNAMRKLGQQDQPLTRVYRQLYNQNLYLAAYAKIYRNNGVLTPGTTDETVDGMNVKRIEAIIEDLKHERFRFSANRRIWIKKKNGKKRPLSIPNFKDKLVQEVIRGLLEAYYEPQFSDNSHGFRPERGCHTALKQIRQQFKAITWYIEGDIKGCFDNIDHNKLMGILSKKIQDNRLLRLIRNGLQAGVVDEWVYERTNSGTPQGGILSPLLANIYLNELDNFVETTLIPEWNIGDERCRNPQARQYEYLIKKAKERQDHEELKRLIVERRNIPSKDVNDPNFRRLKYVRYADDFLLGFIGSYAEAIEIKAKLSEFLGTELKLTLSEEKTLITSARRNKAAFLGYEISTHQSNSKLTMNSALGIKKRSVNGSPRLGVPYGYVQKKSRPYMKNGKPIHRSALMRNSVAEIIQQYQTEYRGIVNYYCYAEDLHVLNSLMYIMEQSLVKTLASKLKISVSKVYRQLRSKVEVNGRVYLSLETTIETDKGIQIFRWGGIPLRREHSKSFNTVLEDTIHRYKWSDRSDLVTRIRSSVCELCDKEGDVEVHHIRKLKDLKTRWRGRKTKPEWVVRMIALQRKTLVVCFDCHRDIHKNDNKKSS